MPKQEEEQQRQRLNYDGKREKNYRQLLLTGGKQTELAEAASELQDYWRSFLVQPDWYILLEPFLRSWMLTDTKAAHERPETEQMREPFVTLVGNMLTQRQIPLGGTGPDFDEPRRDRIERGLPAFEQVIIHHSETTPEVTEQGTYDHEAEARNLNALGFIRQYTGIIFMDTASPWHGKPVYSGHYSPEGDQVFYAYNDLVTPDGTVKRLVSDSTYRLLHAGPQANTNSAGLVMIGNYDEINPPHEQMEGLAQALVRQYSFIPTEKIIGHQEVKPDKPCPGVNFLGKKGWKQDLHARVRELRGEIYSKE